MAFVFRVPARVLPALLRSAILRDTGLIAAGNVASRGLGLLAFALLTRSLSPSEFGLFSLGLAIQMTAAEVAEFGMTASAVRFGAKLALTGEHAELARLFSILLRSRLALSGAVLAFGWMGVAIFGPAIVRDQAGISLLRLGLFGAVTAIIQQTLVAMFQATRQFGRAALTNLSAGVCILVGVGLLIVVGAVSPVSALAVYVLAPVTASVLAWLLSPKGMVTLAHWDGPMARSVFRFGRWMMVWLILVVIQVRLDTFLLASLTSLEEVGYYAAAYRIGSIAQLVPAALATSLGPRFAAGHAGVRGDVKRALWACSAMAVVMAVSAPFAPVAATLIAGSRFVPSGSALAPILLGMAFFTLAIPLTAATLYSLGKTWVAALTAAICLPQTLLLDILLIPRYGALGAGLAYACGQITAFTIVAVVAVRAWRDLGSQTHESLD